MRVSCDKEIMNCGSNGDIPSVDVALEKEAQLFGPFRRGACLPINMHKVVCVCDLVFIIPLQAARRAMAAVVGFSIYVP